MHHEQEQVHNPDDDDDEIEKGDDCSSPLKSQEGGRIQTKSSSCGSTRKTKGLMDCYFPQKSGDMGEKSSNRKIDAKSILRDSAIAMFARWMYDVGLPFNCVNYTDIFSAFIEAVGQYGLEMKSPTYHEVRAYCINLIFGEIFKERPFRTVFNQAIRVHSYIVQRPLLLNMMKRFTKQRSLVKPAKAKFTTSFLTLNRIYEQKSNLKLFVSYEYANSAYGREARGRESVDIMLSNAFWTNVVHALKIGGPLVKVLHLVGGEQRPTMGYLYEAMDRVKEAIRGSFSDKRKYKRVIEIIDKRWTDQIHHPLHATGLVLNPELFYDNKKRIIGDAKLWNGYVECIEKLIPKESDQDKITEQFSTCRNAEQLFGKKTWLLDKEGRSHQLNGGSNMAIPLQNYKSLSSKFYIHTKKRNKLTLKHLNDLVFIKYNRTLRRPYNARNIIDPISLDNIDDANEWLTGVPEDHADEEVFEETSNFTWGDVAEAHKIGERIDGLKGSI
uniref:Uncharacterized protein n=1 Tax=Nicotiana tabacum TaxID=4097 RepID=A0A1S4AWL7_TOBAC|nr:PREDICTED: uncharacterized protein LOC107802079 [Nicotiana tabacum]